MNVVALNRSDEREPEWIDVGLRGSDFRPHFDGYLHNLFTTIHPLKTESETEQFFRTIAIKLTNWVLSTRGNFWQGDRFQIIVGWPLDVRPTGRQVIKTGGDYDTIKRLIDDPELIQAREGWSQSLFQNEEDG